MVKTATLFLQCTTLNTNDVYVVLLWLHVISCFKDSFCTSKNVGIGASSHAMHITAILAGCRKGLLGLAISFFIFSTSGHIIHSSSPLGAPDTVGRFWSKRTLISQRAQTIEWSLMNGHGQGHEP